MKKVSKLYCYYNPLTDMGHIRPIAFSSNFQKNWSVKGLYGTKLKSEQIVNIY